MRGVTGSEFEGGESRFGMRRDSGSLTGLYHLRILLPPSYPMAAPDIMLLTPNGRFELGKKVSYCRPDLGRRWSARRRVRKDLLMTDLHRRPDELSRWVMAACMGRTDWYVCLRVPAPDTYTHDGSQSTSVNCADPSYHRSPEFLDAGRRSSVSDRSGRLPQGGT